MRFTVSLICKNPQPHQSFCCTTHEISTTAATNLLFQRPRKGVYQHLILYVPVFQQILPQTLNLFHVQADLVYGTLYKNTLISICQKHFLKLHFLCLFLGTGRCKNRWKILWFACLWILKTSDLDPRQQKVMMSLFCAAVRAVRWADKAPCHRNRCCWLTNSKSDMWHRELLIALKKLLLGLKVMWLFDLTIHWRRFYIWGCSVISGFISNTFIVCSQLQTH